MNKVIIFKNLNDTNVVVCTPTGEIPIEAVMEKDCPPGAIIIDYSELPQEEEEFFNAWELNNGSVTVNFEKAKNITKNRLRIEREPLLRAQDVLFQRALETNADTTAIVAEKQRLRDITNQADTATTTAQLRNIKINLG